MSGIIWLASYPKSGNTWLRALLTNALGLSDRPADINALLGVPSASRKLFDEWCGVKSSDLLPDEVERLRPRIYEAAARNTSRTLFLKVHDAYTTNSGGEAIFPQGPTKAVIYVVRHPADVAISYAHHRGCSVDQAIDLLADHSHSLAEEATGVEGQLPQRLLSWSEHVSSWLDAPLPVYCVRYEDLSEKPEKTLLSVLRFLGEDCHPLRVACAVHFAAFAELSRQESAHGFFERPGRVRTFFRSGQARGWLGLTDEQARCIREQHAVVIRRLGYEGTSV